MFSIQAFILAATDKSPVNRAAHVSSEQFSV